MDVRFTQHAEDVIAERELKREWIERALDHPAKVVASPDGTQHHLVRIARCGDRVLRVVINPGTQPPSVITAFFDRRVKET
jgi:hypothetical protein